MYNIGNLGPRFSAGHLIEIENTFPSGWTKIEFKTLEVVIQPSSRGKESKKLRKLDIRFYLTWRGLVHPLSINCWKRSHSCRIASHSHLTLTTRCGLLFLEVWYSLLMQLLNPFLSLGGLFWRCLELFDVCVSLSLYLSLASTDYFLSQWSCSYLY